APPRRDLSAAPLYSSPRPATAPKRRARDQCPSGAGLRPDGRAKSSLVRVVRFQRLPVRPRVAGGGERLLVLVVDAVRIAALRSVDLVVRRGVETAHASAVAQAVGIPHLAGFDLR